MLETCVNQGVGLQGIGLHAAPRVIAMASHGSQEGELPLLWSLCSTLVDFGYPVAVLDATTTESLQQAEANRAQRAVADAVVVLLPGGAGAPKAALPTRVTIIQEKMRFAPAVSLVAVGARATFVNNDPWEHHVRASPAGARHCSTASGSLPWVGSTAPSTA